MKKCSYKHFQKQPYLTRYLELCYKPGVHIGPWYYSCLELAKFPWLLSTRCIYGSTSFRVDEFTSNQSFSSNNSTQVSKFKESTFFNKLLTPEVDTINLFFKFRVILPYTVVSVLSGDEGIGIDDMVSGLYSLLVVFYNQI